MVNFVFEKHLNLFESTSEHETRTHLTQLRTFYFFILFEPQLITLLVLLFLGERSFPLLKRKEGKRKRNMSAFC